MARIKLLLLTDHPIVKRGILDALKDEVSIEIVGEAQSLIEAVHKAYELKPDAILVDPYARKIDGREASMILQEMLKDIMVFNLEDRDRVKGTIRGAMPGQDMGTSGGHQRGEDEGKAGSRQDAHLPVNGIVDPDLGKMLKQRSRLAADIQIKARLVTRGSNHGDFRYFYCDPNWKLTEAEKDVLSLIVEGHSNREIAEELYLSVNTVKCHIRRILQKLHVTSRSEAIRVATRSIIKC